MPRAPRIVVPDAPHHVTQRGNRREQVFFSDADRRMYLRLLGEYCGKHSLEVLAYCLMPNHVHLVVVPHTVEALGVALKPIHLRYAQHINWTRSLSGRLWQGRFFSCPMDEPHLFAAIRYVERNPVRAGMVGKSEAYPWSSAAVHCAGRRDPLLSDPFGVAEAIGDWASWLSESEDAALTDALRRSTHTGRPLGDTTFQERIESVLGRTVRGGKPGRPRKKTRDATLFSPS